MTYSYLFFIFRTGMAGVPGTASSIFETVKDTGANVVMISQVGDDLCSFVLYLIQYVKITDLILL